MFVFNSVLNVFIVYVFIVYQDMMVWKLAKQKSLYYVFVWVYIYVNLCKVTVIELIVFLYNEVIVQ